MSWAKICPLTPCSARPCPACHIGSVFGSENVIRLTTAQEVIYIAAAVVFVVLCIVIAHAVGRRSGRRAISQRLTALGSRLGLDPPEDESNIETSLAYLEQVTSGAAQAVTESARMPFGFDAPWTP